MSLATAISIPAGRFEIRRDWAWFRAALLTAPLAIYLFVFFVTPLCMVLGYAILSPEVKRGLPETSEALERWNGSGQPADDVYQALGRDLTQADAATRIAEAARRLNYEISGYRQLISRTKRNLREEHITDAATARAAIIGIDQIWADPAYWNAFKRASAEITPHYLLAALDLKVGDDGGIERVPQERRIFLGTIARSLWTAGVVTITCLMLGYPLAYAITSLDRRFAGALLFSILLPFWTSLLARTTAWIIVLSNGGVVNSLLISSGLVDQPLAMVYNRVGVYVTMVHMLLPFTVLPILSVMRGIPANYLKASASLGASPLRTFTRIYLPLSAPGIAAGAMMTFIIAMGYYITPLLVGGAGDTMIAFFISFFVNDTINWGMAAAIALIMLVGVLGLYALLGRVAGVTRIVGIVR